MARCSASARLVRVQYVTPEFRAIETTPQRASSFSPFFGTSFLTSSDIWERSLSATPFHYFRRYIHHNGVSAAR